MGERDDSEHEEGEIRTSRDKQTHNDSETVLEEVMMEESVKETLDVDVVAQPEILIEQEENGEEQETKMDVQSETIDDDMTGEDLTSLVVDTCHMGKSVHQTTKSPPRKLSTIMINGNIPTPKVSGTCPSPNTNLDTPTTTNPIGPFSGLPAGCFGPFPSPIQFT